MLLFQKEYYLWVLLELEKLYLLELSLAKLAEDVATASGVDVGPQIQQWTRQTGYPTLRATSRPAEGGVEIEKGSMDAELIAEFCRAVREADGE